MPSGSPATYTAMATTSLWVEHMNAQQPALGLIEAELGRRGETSFGTDYLGRRTSSAYGKPLYARSAITSAAKDCSDFKSSASAQQYFLVNGGPTRDPNGLDGDGDGLACEWGTKLKQNTARYTASYRPAPTRRSYTSGCYTGPRGGRYTITASGAKNYERSFGVGEVDSFDAGILGTSPTPPSVGKAASLDQIAAMLQDYIKKVNDPGVTCTFISGNTGKRVKLGADDSGDFSVETQTDS